MRQLVRSVWGAICLVHPFPVATVVVTSGLMIVAGRHSVPDAQFMARALATVLLSQVVVGALNDYVDREDDMRMQRNKPIPAGRTSPQVALGLIGVGSLGIIPLAATFGVGPFVLVLAGTAAGLAYDLGLKRTPLSFSAYVAGFSLLFLWTRAISGRDLGPAILALIPASLLVVAAHLAQSYPDIETDRALGSRGLAVVLGPTRTVQLLWALFAGTAAVAIGSALLFHSWLALVLSLTSAALPVVLLRLVHARSTDLNSRRNLFRAIAPGLAFLALSCLISWRNVL